jgi:hypothetical protein
MGGYQLAFTDLPVRVHNPIAVRVTAYQWGKGTEPVVQAATPVTQAFYIKPPGKH